MNTKNLITKTILCLLVAYPSLSIAKNNNTNKRAQAVVNLVNKAKAYIKSNGVVKAACAFNNPNGQFHRGELYIFAWTCGNKDKKNNSFAIAGAVDPGVKVFTNYSGIPVFEKISAAINKQPKGAWLSYSWKNFTNNKLMLKHTYGMRLDKTHICLGSGYYSNLKNN